MAAPVEVLPGSNFINGQNNLSNAANEEFNKLTNDPLMMMRAEEQKALQRILNNPLKMKDIRGEVEKRQAENWWLLMLVEIDTYPTAAEGRTAVAKRRKTQARAMEREASLSDEVTAGDLVHPPHLCTVRGSSTFRLPVL